MNAPSQAHARWVAELVDTLRERGIKVSIDNAVSVARLLQLTLVSNSVAPATVERFIAGICALLGRSPEERIIVDQVAREMLMKSTSPDVPYEESNVMDLGLISFRSRLLSHLRIYVRRYGWLLLVIAAVVGIYGLVQYVIPPLSARWPGPIPNPDDGNDPTKATLPTEWGGLSGVLLGLFISSLYFTPILLLLLVGLWLAMLPARRSAFAVQRLIVSPDRQLFQVSVEPGRGEEPVNRGLIREFAFQLARATDLATADWLHPRHTVEMSARSAGHLSLCFDIRLEHRPILFVEDVSRSMERWPVHGHQLVRALRRQGQIVIHRLVQGDLDRLQSSLDDASSRTLAAEMSGIGPCRVLVLSDASRVEDDSRFRDSIAAIALNTELVWIHPRPEEMWGQGARWLSKFVTMAPLNSQGLRFLCAEKSRGRRLQRRWHPHAAPDATRDALLQSWRHTLGDKVFGAFACSALLSQVKAWNSRHWWALISDGVITGDQNCLERIWDLPGFSVLPGGAFSVPAELLGDLLDYGRKHCQTTYAAVARWVIELTQRCADRTTQDSMARIVSGVYLDRLEFTVDPDGHPAGQRAVRLQKQGYESIVWSHASTKERMAWRLEEPLMEGKITREVVYVFVCFLFSASCLMVTTWFLRY